MSESPQIFTGSHFFLSLTYMIATQTMKLYNMHVPFIVLVMTIILPTYAMRGRNALQRTTHAQ